MTDPVTLPREYVQAALKAIDELAVRCLGNGERDKAESLSLLYHNVRAILSRAGEGESPTPSRYQWSYNGAHFDFYRLCEIVGVTHHAHAHAFKKVIRAGKSVKPVEQDIDEAIAALRRWKEMLTEPRPETR